MEDQKKYGNGQFMRDVVGGITVAMVLWMASSLIEIKEEIAKTNGNRWTSGDQASFTKELQKQHSDIWTAIVTIREAIPKEVPPQWFREEVNELEDKVKELEKYVRGSESKLR